MTITLDENQAGFCDVDGWIESIHAGFIGDGYANTNNIIGSSIVWSIDAPTAGEYVLQWRYANAVGSRSGNVLNGGMVMSNISFPPTGAWSNWQLSDQVILNLFEGQNSITLRATTTNGLPNIDYLQVTGLAPVAGGCN